MAIPEPPHSALLRAFEAWCGHQRLVGRLRRGSSEAVYRAMWQALAVWCVSQRPALRLVDLRAPALTAYLAGRTGLVLADGVLTPRYQARLLALVRRVQAHQAWRASQSGAAPARPASALPDALRAAVLHAAAVNDSTQAPPLHLHPPDALRLQQWLCQTDDNAPDRWQTTRDRCAVALQLGGGLGPGELRALRLADVVSQSGHALGPPITLLRVAASGSAPAHVAPLAPWAGALLTRWQVLRRAEALAGDWLLPSTRSGKPWGKVAQYESARRVLVDAGLDADGGGSFRLRHSFALRQLQHGHDEARVSQWLGVVDPAVMQRYRAVLGEPLAAAKTDSAATPGPPPLPV